MEPLVSVLMSVYDTPDEWLSQAIESVLQQTYQNFEFIIVNDCCKESNKKIIDFYQQKDSRIIVKENSENLGLTRSLNVGLRIANGELLARIDADDWALPERLARQVECFEKNENLVLCGTAGYSCDKDKQSCLDVFDETSNTLKCFLTRGNLFVHSSIMIRLSTMRLFNLTYDEHFKMAQDYELWCRLRDYGDIMNLPNRLCVYRVHDKQISSKSLNEQNEFRNLIVERNLKYLGIKEDFKSYLILMGYEKGKIKSMTAFKIATIFSRKLFLKYGFCSKNLIKECLWTALGMMKHNVFG